MTVLTMALAVAGCGGPEPADAPTRNAVTEVIGGYFEAFSRGDGARACTYLTRNQRAKIADDGLDCAQAFRRTADVLPPELRRDLRRTRVTGVEVDGEGAFAEVRLDSEYASEPRTNRITLVRQDDEWRLAELPADDAGQDPLTTCFVSGVRAFDEDDADPFWAREGREDFVHFLRETCRRAVDEGIIEERQGELSARQRERLEAVYAAVLREMIDAGRVERP